MSDISEPGPEVEKVFEGLPVTLNLGENQIIGWSNAYRNKDDGTTTIVMTLDSEASEKLVDLTETFKLFALGFAGVVVKKEPPQ